MNRQLGCPLAGRRAASCILNRGDCSRTGGMLAVTGMPAAMKTARTVMAPTTALPRASGMKLYLQGTVSVTLQMWSA